jgi:hypothetical protein
MYKKGSVTPLKILLYALLLTGVLSLVSCKEPVKEPSVAGAFYPAEETTLRQMVQGFLKQAENKPVSGKLVALVSPHAGYVFSGHVAAHGYKHLKDVNTVILIGPSHYSSFKGASVYDRGSFKTPLGVVKIDRKIARRLIDETADVRFYPEAYEKEHSLEVQLPFLQAVLKDFKIVPILISMPTKESYEHLVLKLTEILSENNNAMLVASTDLSHYHDYSTAVDMDRKLIDAIKRLSVMETQRLVMSGQAEMCGFYPTLIAMEVSRRLGANLSVLFKYANSGDVTQDKHRVVGYGSIGIYKSPYTEEDKKELLSIARNAVISYVRNGTVPQIEVENPKLMTDGAVFVTINKNGHLRGCIGHIYPVMPLYESVLRNAIAACSKDPRFPPMKEYELKDMEIEISILSYLVPLKDVKDIEIGKHGLYIIKGQKAGLLLPQVPVEYGWDRETFLKQVSLKAGLPEDAWKNGASLYTFTAEIIREH